jgi:hypothetical protein
MAIQKRDRDEARISMVRRTLLVEVHFPVKRRVPRNPGEKTALRIETGFMHPDPNGRRALRTETERNH